MMDDKRDEAKFTIKFNPIIPSHQEAIRILNGAGRRKAALIAEALCKYKHYEANTCADSPKGEINEAVQTTQYRDVCKDSELNKSDDDLLGSFADSAESFFN